VEQIHKRSAYRITVALRAQLERAGAESGARQGESGPAVVTNLSGGSLAATPQGFPRQGNPSGAAARRQSHLAGIRAHVVETRVT